MEKDILNILNSKNKKENIKDKGKDIAIFLNDLESLEKERTKKTNYNSEVSKLVKLC